MKRRGPRFDMVGNPIVPGRGSQVGVIFITKDDMTMAKAESNGSYVLNGHHFRIRKGDPIPDGATFTGDEEFMAAAKAQQELEGKANTPPTETKALDKAPSNKSKA